MTNGISISLSNSFFFRTMKYALCHTTIYRMEQRFRNQLIDLRANFLANNGVRDIKTGNWDTKSHYHFMVLYKKYIHKGKREDLLERAIAEMPEKTSQDIEVRFVLPCIVPFLISSSPLLSTH